MNIVPYFSRREPAIVVVLVEKLCRDGSDESAPLVGYPRCQHARLCFDFVWFVRNAAFRPRESSHAIIMSNLVLLRPWLIRTKHMVLRNDLLMKTAIAESGCVPARCMSRIIKKKITRLPSDTHVYQEEVDDNKLGPNDSVPLELINRNPRNLEQLSLDPKPLGWELEKPTKTFWNK